MILRNLKESQLLLPYNYKPAGFILILPGAFLLLLRFYFEIKPAFLNVKVFAFYSTYLGSKYFSVIENHITEELGGLFIFLGMILINLTKEKNEKIEYDHFRLKAFILTFYATYIYIILSVVFVFGIAFIKVILIGCAAQSILYFLLFKFFVSYNRKPQHQS